VFLESNDLTPAQGRRSNRSKHEPKKDRFTLTLTPDEYRPGPRNKKIDSVDISRKGFVAAGSDKGDIYLWKMDAGAIKKHNAKDAFRSVGSFKRHTKTVHFCEFSPSGRYLFTGSVDGTAKIWETCKKDQTQEDGFELVDKY
jgi:WD40 repeat protein